MKKNRQQVRSELMKELAALRQRVAELQHELTNHRDSRSNELEKEGRFKDLLENLRDGLLLADKESKRFLMGNRAIQDMLGYSAEELLLLAIADIHPKQDQSLVLQRFEELARKEIGIAPDIPVMRKDGTVFYADITSSYPLVFNGRECAMGIFRDVTERRRTEEALIESETKYRTLFEGASDAIFLLKNGRCVECNDSTLGVFRCTREQFVGSFPYGFSPLLQDDGRSSKESALEKLAEAHSLKPQCFEWRHCRSDGTTFDAEVTLNRLDTPKGVLILGIVRDVTDRKEAEEALKGAHQQLMDIIQFLPDATLVIDREGKVIAWNLAMEKMTGVSRQEILGNGDYAYGIPFYNHPRPILVDLVLEQGSEPAYPYDYFEWRGRKVYAEVFAPNVNGKKGAYLWGTASPLYDGGGNLIGAIESIRDISEHREMEIALRQRERELEQKTYELEEINTALNVLLHKRGEDQKELQESILSNMKKVVMPYLEKVQQTRLDDVQRTYLRILESHLNEIFSPFLKHLSTMFSQLTPTEVEIASLVKDGKTSKEMARLLGVAPKTIAGHRYNLRTKLGLKNEKVNLRSHLLSLE